jgi:hypothetical protein
LPPALKKEKDRRERQSSRFARNASMTMRLEY